MLDKKEIRLQWLVVLLCNDAEDSDEEKYVAFCVITSDLLFNAHNCGSSGCVLEMYRCLQSTI